MIHKQLKPPFNPIKTNDNPNTKVITPLPRLAILTIINGNNVTTIEPTPITKPI